MADRMTLRELEATVLRLRDEITLATQSSADQASLEEELRVFERALGRRQAGRIALAFATAASRRQVGTSIATPRGGISAIAKASIELDLTARSLFWQGVYTGLVDEIPPGKVRDFLTDVQQNWPVLNVGYNAGLAQGLWHGAVNLAHGLALLAQLALWASPGGMALELRRMIQDPQAYYAARQAEYERLQKTIAAVHRFLVDFKADPTIVLQLSAELGVAIGEGLGAKIRAFMDEPAYEKGRDIGDVVGQVLFEVLLQILLAVATVGIGNAIRAGAAGGEVAASSGRLALAIRRVLEASPAVRRLVMEFAEHADLASDVAGTGRRLEQEAAAARGLVGETGGAVGTAETTAEASRVEAIRAAEAAKKIPAKEAENFLGRGFFAVTDRPSYVVRVGPPGKYADHIFTSAQEAKDYARWLADRGEASIREASALPRVWQGGAQGNPVDAARVFEVPKGTPYIQGVVEQKLEGGTVANVPKIYAGGGPQVVIPQNTIGKLVEGGEFPVTKP
jgi:hypothetical protein